MSRYRPAWRATGLVAASVAGIWLATWGVATLRAGPGHPPGDEAGAATVVDVVDGDTLVVRIGGSEEPVRLIGIDTPETVAPGRPVECYGSEASQQLESLVPPGTTVRLERDLEPRDQYGRLLVYVYRADDNLFVNQAMIADGFAATLVFPPNTALRAELAQSERAARAQRAGMWGACGGPDTPLAPAN
jgi:micrococcal nuclease